DTGGYIPVIEGRTYTAVIQWYGAGDHTFRLESFDHQIETVKKAGAPSLVPGETAHVDFNGELLSGAALFTPAETGLYTVEAGNGAYKFILGEDGVFFDGGHPDDSYVKARLLAGKTYLFYIYNKDKTPASADVKVKLNAEKAFAPVTYNAADAAGTLRYTVIILQDNYVMVREYAEEQGFAKRLCADLIAADGTDYIALVDMYEGNIILWDGYSQYGRDPYPWTDDIFTNDTGKLNTCIGWIDGTVMRNCDVSGALDYAGLLLDAARATYGDKVETNIVLFSASDFKDGARVYPGRYSADDDSNGTWALCDYCNAAYLKAEEVKSKGHKIYSMSVNDRFYASEDMEYPLEERENNFLRRVMKDLSSGEEYYFDIWRGDDIKLAADAVARHITGK
ncbi:MAG: hypothetical protein IK047_00655, partial [Clostridia bacterium]|nr:hypothetical protein [Clostridia bacterium]